jgi:integrase
MKNAIDQASGKKLSTRQLLDKIPTVSCLYRHRVTGRYYAIKSVRGKLKTEVLRSEHGEPISDRKLAERRLKDWIEGFENPASTLAGGPLALDALVSKYRQTMAGLKPKTRINIEWMIGNLEKHWHLGMKIQVREIKVSDVDVFLATFTKWKARTYNTFTMYLRQLFRLAVNDGTIKFNPLEKCAHPRKRVKKEPRPIPSVEQFQKIVAFIRDQRFTDHSEDSADLAQFLGLAGLGEAEADSLYWRDLDLSKTHFKMKRHKTGKYFDVPFYPKLLAFLTDLRVRQNQPSAGEKVFRISSCKKSLATACNKLGYPPYSPRALRCCAIVSQLRAGVGVKLVSKWQGHSDGGALILNTYSEIISESDKEFELRELSKLN